MLLVFVLWLAGAAAAFPPRVQFSGAASMAHWPRASPAGSLAPVSVINHTSPGAGDNLHGFEGGKAVRVGGSFHLFTAGTFALPYGTATRLEHWASEDRLSWRRVGVLLNSSSVGLGRCALGSLQAAVWEPVPFYDRQQGRWLVFYTAYMCNGQQGVVGNGAYNGSIWSLSSQVPGAGGIAGPYSTVPELVFHGDIQTPVGLGVDTFHPYGPINGSYYALTSRAGVQGDGCVSLIRADRVTGPWSWVSKSLGDASWWYLENPVVSKLPQGGWMAAMDALGGDHTGLMDETRGMVIIFSEDGVHWQPRLWPVAIPGGCRTPLGVSWLERDEFALFYTYTEDHRPFCYSTGNDTGACMRWEAVFSVNVTINSTDAPIAFEDM